MGEAHKNSLGASMETPVTRSSLKRLPTLCGSSAAHFLLFFMYVQLFWDYIGTERANSIGQDKHGVELFEVHQ